MKKNGIKIKLIKYNLITIKIDSIKFNIVKIDDVVTAIIE